MHGCQATESEAPLTAEAVLDYLSQLDLGSCSRRAPERGNDQVSRPAPVLLVFLDARGKMQPKGFVPLGVDTDLFRDHGVVRRFGSWQCKCVAWRSRQLTPESRGQ